VEIWHLCAVTVVLSTCYCRPHGVWQCVIRFVIPAVKGMPGISVTMLAGRVGSEGDLFL